MRFESSLCDDSIRVLKFKLIIDLLVREDREVVFNKKIKIYVFNA